MVSQTYDIDDAFGVASRRKYIQDMKMRIEEAENRGKNIRLRKDWLRHQKNHFIMENDDVNRQLERPMMLVRTEEELQKKNKKN